ncbi:MAG TPA: YbaK/EbsC family protein [Candidatus Saccharimonadales bacterium]|jgi:prolyl-tRNA editing enzyme YbaK/EbsC (Cys-tRNA(Pro) deacylase)
MTEHTIGQKITSLLQSHSCWFETFKHEPVRTSEQAAATRPGYTLAQGAKISGEGKRFIMLVMPANQKFNSAKVKAVARAKDIRFATEDEVATITNGVMPGGVPPFGNMLGLQVICGSSLFKNEKIVFNAARDFSIAMRAADYRKLVQPLVTYIV